MAYNLDRLSMTSFQIYPYMHQSSASMHASSCIHPYISSAFCFSSVHPWASCYPFPKRVLIYGYLSIICHLLVYPFVSLLIHSFVLAICFSVYSCIYLFSHLSSVYHLPFPFYFVSFAAMILTEPRIHILDLFFF